MRPSLTVGATLSTVALELSARVVDPATLVAVTLTLRFAASMRLAVIV